MSTILSDTWIKVDNKTTQQSNDCSKISLEDFISTVLSRMLQHKSDNPLDVFPLFLAQVKRDGKDMVDSIKRDVHPYYRPVTKNLRISTADRIEWAKKLVILSSPLPPEKKSKVPNPDEEGEEAQEIEEEEQEQEDAEEEGVHDLFYDFKIMNTAGIGLTDYEVQSLLISMYRLKQHAKKANKSFLSMRWWGKIYGIYANYYIVEVEEEPKEEEQKEEEEEQEETERKIFGTPAETTGTNRYVYYVTTSQSFPAFPNEWIKLPNVQPEHIQQARMIKKLFTGNLNAPVTSHPPFPGDEKVLLRAQIARITASTKLAPKDFIVFEEDQGEEEEEDEDGNPVKKEDHLINAYAELPGLRKNEEFDSLKFDMSSLKNWIHIEPYILHSQGRATLYKPQEEEEEQQDDEEEEEQNTPKKEPVERIPPLLTSVDLDDFKTGSYEQRSWVLREHFTLLQDHSPMSSHVISLRSLRWPGAYTVAEKVPETGVKYCSIYIGDGLKAFSGDNFATYTPTYVNPIQTEYSIDPEELYTIGTCEHLRWKKKTVIVGKECTDPLSKEQIIQYEEPKPPAEEKDPDRGDEEDDDNNEEE
jgi:radial spoke head protein 4A